MFNLNDKVVYPGYGVAQINRIVEKDVAGAATIFYELEFLNKSMTVLIPMTKMVAVGIRRLSTVKSIDDIFKTLSEPVQKLSTDSAATNWNKRNKEYQHKLRTGNLKEICKIYRDLKHISTRKELSFGEKNLLQQTETLLVEEISIVQKVAEDKAVEHLRSLFKAAIPTSSSATMSSIL